MERDRLHQPVALVEHSEHGDALRHWGHACLPPGQHLRRVRGLLLRLFRRLRTAGAERQRKHQGALAKHLYSGVQGW
jgi:hypothetical protein